MFIKTIYNIKEQRYVPVDWCMSKEDCKIGRYHEKTLEAGVSSVLEEFDCFDFVGVHNTYELLMVDVLDYSLENEECDFDFVRWKYLSCDPDMRRKMVKEFKPLSFSELNAE